MTPVIEAIVKRWGLDPQDGSSLTVPCATWFRGFTLRDYVEVDAPGFRYADHWSTGYREIFISQAERAIFTYCEGDLDLTVDPDDATFQARLDSAAKFYAEVA